MTTGRTEEDPDIPADVHDASAFFQRRRSLFWAALAWMAGVVLDDRLANDTLFEKSIPLIVSLAVLVGACAWIGARTSRRKLLALCLAGFTAGFFTHGVRARILPENHVSSMAPSRDSVIHLQGVIRQVSRTQFGGARWVLDCELLFESVGPGANSRETTGLVQLFVANPPDAVLEGSRVRVLARIGAPRDTFPDNFDVVAYLKRNGIYRTGSVVPKSEIQTDLPRAWSPLLWMRRGSHALSARVDGLLPSLQLEGRTPESQSALLSALLFGRREQIDRHDRDAFAATGTAHLLAISGLQIQFLALLFWNVLKRCGVSRRTNSILLFVATWAYTALSGAEPPIVRAAVMISLLLFSQWVWREADGLSLLGAAAIAILALDPSQLFQAGFQLSFAAVFALITLVPLLNDALRRRTEDPLAPLDTSGQRGLRERLTNLALVSFAAWLGTAPIIAWHMGQFSILCVPANLVAVPLSGIAMICGIAGLSFGAISSALAAPFAWAAFSLLALLQTLTDFAASVPFGTLQVAAPPVLVLLLYAGVTTVLWIYRGSHRLRILAVIACTLMIGSVAAGALARDTPPLTPSVTFLHLGRGRATVIRNGNDAVLIDAGTPSTGVRLASHLEALGIHRLKAVIVLENEFGCLGGLREVLERFPTERVVLPYVAAPDNLRRNVESTLRARKIPYSESPASLPSDVLAGFSIKLADDNLPASAGRISESAFAAWISHGESELLIVPTRSIASLDRFMENNPPAFFKARTVALTGHYSDHWPRNTQAFLKRCEPERLISLAREEHDALDSGLRSVHAANQGALWLRPYERDWDVSVFNGLWLPQK